MTCSLGLVLFAEVAKHQTFARETKGWMKMVDLD